MIVDRPSPGQNSIPLVIFHAPIHVEGDAENVGISLFFGVLVSSTPVVAEEGRSPCHKFEKGRSLLVLRSEGESHFGVLWAEKRSASLDGKTGDIR